MSITDELRKWGYGFCGSSYEVVNAIADRIDAEHERKVQQAYADGLNEQIDFHDNFIPSNYVLLPVDADGEPIRVGDVMDSRVDYLFDGKPFTVRALVLCEDGWEVADGRFGNRYEPDLLRHHHAPTVEDVLTEFGIDWEHESDCEDRAALLKEYAAKLRLAGDAE